MVALLNFKTIGVEWCQPQVEPQRLRRCQGFENTTTQDMETGHAHVQ